jgi:DNA primase
MDVEIYLEEMGIDYYPSAARFMVVCPFHDDHTPSCGIWADSGYFKCFGCGEAGSFAEFMAEVKGITIREAVRRLQGQDDISDLEDSIGHFLDQNEKVFRYFEWASFWRTYPAVIPETRAWDYLVREGGKPEGRKLTADSVLRFGIRWGGDTGKYRYRVILPIQTVEGKLLSYVGRTIKVGMVPKTKKSRSPHRTLFGLDKIVKKVAKVPLLIIVEGEFDAIYLQQYGIPAVSNMGTIPMGAAKIRLLRRYASKVGLSYDGDAAGEKRMYGDERKRGEINVLSKHIPTISVGLPDDRDPNDLSEKEVDEIYGRYRLSCLIS